MQFSSGEPIKDSDMERMYLFQLRRDLDLIQEKEAVSFKKKVDEYHKERYADSATYRSLAKIKPLGRLGQINDVAVKRQDDIWRETGVPYGLLAHRYFGQWKRNLPGGPSAEFLRARYLHVLSYPTSIGYLSFIIALIIIVVIVIVVVVMIIIIIIIIITITITITISTNVESRTRLITPCGMTSVSVGSSRLWKN